MTTFCNLPLSLPVDWLLLGGMPAVRLTSDTSTRMQGISFFLMGIVVSTLVVWWAWNWLRRDFTALPKLSFIGAAGLTVLWGMLFVIVLTMISGARELMTPKAWRPNGLTYAIDDEPGTSLESLAEERENEIKLVAATLTYYKRTRGGELPEDVVYLGDAAEELGFISLAHSLEMNYWYDASQSKSSPILIRQIAQKGGPAWGITAEGEIVRLDEAEKPERRAPKTDSDGS
ncbi:hypothetical protein LOC68_17555 [Blastopirellula sp. JC732]|uniref:Uncharacterized protein n=1 Tax=Blastopirellula sediminis TaxID=2894196 RepID=A0A9X1MP19_9BACT|nr:hypothetical protein [Blastopirellula sediminis]MCC9606498.1 hypothetical protein [Blastopirellula sediminis]MCC9630204.1 hypothetical protein [Blastopirellula sediminis]